MVTKMVEPDGEGDAPTYKVGKVIERADLEGMGERLEQRWLGTTGESHSLRELADEFNVAVLRAALRSNGEQPLAGEVEAMYQALVEDSASSGDRTQIRRTLERKGIDIDRIEEDFVTHQAIHTYLTKGRGVQKQTEVNDRLDAARRTIERLQSRLSAVTETSLSQLRSGDNVTLGEFEVLVTVDVVCTDCGTHSNVAELLDGRGCDCDA